MAELTYRDAVIRGIAQEMSRDPDVVFLGEDVAKAGGVFKATVGLYEQFGPLRVRDTPISENTIVGMGVGAAMTGLRPVVELLGQAPQLPVSRFPELANLTIRLCRRHRGRKENGRGYGCQQDPSGYRVFVHLKDLPPGD